MDMTSVKFTKTHEWVSRQGEIATIGISDFAVQELTDVVHIELPQIGKIPRAGEEIGEIESVKAVSDLYSPVSGEVIEVNEELENDLSRLSDDPFGAGWIARLRISDSGELDALMDHAAYQKFCESH